MSELNEIVPVARCLLVDRMDRQLQPEHQTTHSDDYSHPPLFRFDRVKEAHFSNLGLTSSSKPRFQPSSGYVLQPLPVRTGVLKTGALAATSPSVISIAARTEQMLDDVQSHMIGMESRMKRSILWPDLKFRFNVLKEVSEIPDDSAEFANLTWVSKRKRVVELIKKWKAKKERQQSDSFFKRKKFLSKLKEYGESELRGMFPRLNEDIVVPVERVTSIRCDDCRRQVFQVEGQTFHKCPTRSNTS